MLTFPKPATLNGDALTAELTAAGVPAAAVSLLGDEVRVIVEDPDKHQATVKRIVAAHVAPPPAPPQPSLADRLAAVEARLDKAASAAVTGDAAKLRDNLR